jgi:GNAT superfamily N-acetyltransferase
MDWKRDGYVISDDPGLVDIDVTWGFLRTAYWSKGVPRETVERSIAGSIPFGLYAPDGSQAGFARAITDRATFAWIADVFVLEPHRGKGLAKWLVETIISTPPFDRLRLILLATADAHGLYERFGFERAPEGWHMTLSRPADL